jgi:predicted aconitase with swiveling domain
MSCTIFTNTVIAGDVKGELIVSQQTFSFFGGFDFNSGDVVDPKSDIHGANLKGKIFAYPRGKGSSSTAGVILEALRQETAPKAIINVESEKILAVGAIVAKVMFNWNIPIISISAEDFQQLTSGTYATIKNGQLTWGKLDEIEN